MQPSGFYAGRLACDGAGNLLADEGEFAGYPIAFHEGSYVFVQPGEPSHNKRHESNVIEMVMTQDQVEDMPGFAGTPDNPVEGREHHWGPLEDDAHFDADARNKTKTVFDPDVVAAKITGHTEAHSG